MRDLLLLAVQLVVTLAKLTRPGGVRSVIAESLLLKHQLIISRRSRRRAPPLTTMDRFVLGLTTLFVCPRRVAKLAAILKPATLLRFHKALVDRKYRRLFSSAGTRRKPGPKGPTEEIVAAILEMKLRNPRFGNQRIAEQISHAFAVQIDRDVVRRVLAKHYGPDHPDASGPSWLTFIAQAKDSLWSVDLFRCESILLRSHWVLVVIDVCTRRIIGFGIGGEYIDGPAVCRMFNRAIAGHAPPVRISTDHDPLFRFHRWLANLRIFEVEEIKSVPYAPTSHPFVERLIGTIRREYLDHTFFWNSIDLHRKLEKFRAYYNGARVHRSLNGTTPANCAGTASSAKVNLAHYAWERHCNGRFETPVAA
jgi:transposase InsO family protein